MTVPDTEIDSGSLVCQRDELVGSPPCHAIGLIPSKGDSGGKFKHGETTGIKANPDDVSKEMRCLRDQSRKRIFTVKEFLRPQQITSFFSKMVCKRRDATDSDDEAEEFARQQAAMHSDVIEVLRQEITHPLLFSGKNLSLMTESEIESLKITQMRSIVRHFSITVKARKKNVYFVAIIEFLKRCSCKQLFW